MLRYLLVFDLRIHHALVVFQQLFPRLHQLLVGAEDSDELADIQIAPQNKDAADRIEQEWCRLEQEIVREISEGLVLVDFHPDFENARKLCVKSVSE